MDAEQVWRDAPGGEHLLSFSATLAERQSVLATWAVDGLEQGARFVYAEPDDRPASGTLLVLLTSQQFDTELATRDGRLLQVPMETLYSPRAPELITARAQADGFAAVRVASLATDAMGLLGREFLVAFEGELAQASRGGPFSALCQYDPLSAGEWLTKVSGLHPLSGSGSPFFAIPGDGAIMLFGEVDATNSEAMDQAIEEATRLATDELRVDLAGVELLSAAGCRAILHGTRDFRDRGGRVVLVGQRSVVRRVLELLQVGRVSGVDVVDEGS
jgi:anti-anti-sigma factor